MKCKYYKQRMSTLLEYCRCLYKLKDCGCGGNLHIVLDDGNYTDSDILFCLQRCIENPESEESDLGILICKELLKLNEKERVLFDRIWGGFREADCIADDCKNCWFITDHIPMPNLKELECEVGVRGGYTCV